MAVSSGVHGSCISGHKLLYCPFGLSRKLTMEIKISDELNNIIRYAREEAMRTGSYGIGPDHLFLGMMRQAENEACKVIVNLG